LAFDFVADHTQRFLPEKSQKRDLVSAKVVCHTLRSGWAIADSDWLVSRWLRVVCSWNETELFRNCIGSSDFCSVVFSVEQQREATMRDPSSTDAQQTKLIPGKPWLFSDDYDDEDEADYDDSDDEEKPASVSQERWLSRPDFGSPEWWSRI
jgi:hypothetical protein